MNSTPQYTRPVVVHKTRHAPNPRIQVLRFLPPLKEGALKAFVEVQVGSLCLRNCRILQFGTTPPQVMLPQRGFLKEKKKCFFFYVTMQEPLWSQFRKVVLDAWVLFQQKKEGVPFLERPLKEGL